MSLWHFTEDFKTLPLFKVFKWRYRYPGHFDILQRVKSLPLFKVFKWRYHYPGHFDILQKMLRCHHIQGAYVDKFALFLLRIIILSSTIYHLKVHKNEMICTLFLYFPGIQESVKKIN